MAAQGPYTHRNIWRLTAPMIISNVSVPLIGIVDTAVMGHLDHPRYLAAVAVGGTIFSFLFVGLNFLRMGTTGLAAQAHGTGQRHAERCVLLQALLVSQALAAALLLLQWPLGWLAMELLQPEADVLPPAWTYFLVRIWAAPAALANFALVGWFIGMQNTRVPLAVMLTVNLTNIVLSVLLVVGFGMGAGGVAAASVIAEFTGLAVALSRARGLLPDGWRAPWSEVSDRARLESLVHVNANLLVRTLSLMFVFGFITAQGARAGTAILAANAILLNFQYFMAYALDGFAHAAEALAGRAVGERNAAGFRRAVRLCLAWSLGVAAVFAGGYLLLGPSIIALMTSQPDLEALTARYLPWMVLLPLVSVWSFLFDGVFVGATWAVAMRNSMILATGLVFLPVFYLSQDLGNHGLWLSFTAFMAVRGLTMGWIYRRRAGSPGLVNARSPAQTDGRTA